MIKWGIIGCGDVVERKSGGAFQNIPDAQLLAVMRRNGDKAAGFAKRYGVPKWYDKAEALINDPEIEAVYVATPPAFHEPYAIAAMKAGKHVYLEKPMALEHHSASRILEVAKECQAKLAIAHYRRALPAFQKVKALLEEEIIGQPLFAEIKILQPSQSGIIAASESNWRIDPEVSGGGYFHDLAPHQIDLMVCFFGGIKVAAGFSGNQAAAYNADDIVNGIIEFENGVQFRGLWCFSVPSEEAVDSCTIVGSKGKLTFSFFGEAVVVWNAGQKQTFTFQNPGFVQQPMIEKVNRYFLGKGDNPCPAEEAVEGIRIMDVFTGKGSIKYSYKTVSCNAHPK